MVNKKYDCYKTLDFVHEQARMCQEYTFCSNCPAITQDDNRCYVLKTDDINEDIIQIVQNWSNTHPEEIYLSKNERIFLNSFDIQDLKWWFILNKDGIISLNHNTFSCNLNHNMFDFLEEGEEVSLLTLYNLGVKDDE